jgi:steroid delta-isomerase-like uncharacterized protein
MSKEQLEQLDEQHLSTWDAHDPDAFVAPFADDFIWHDWTLAEPIRTKEAARQFYRGWIVAFPDLKTVSAIRVIGDDAVATEIEWTGTNTGPMFIGGTEFPPTNKTVRGRGTYIARVKDGMIVEFRSHPDVAGLAAQLGLMPGA